MDGHLQTRIAFAVYDTYLFLTVITYFRTERDLQFYVQAPVCLLYRAANKASLNEHHQISSCPSKSTFFPLSILCPCTRSLNLQSHRYVLIPPTLLEQYLAGKRICSANVKQIRPAWMTDSAEARFPILCRNIWVKLVSPSGRPGQYRVMNPRAYPCHQMPPPMTFKQNPPWQTYLPPPTPKVRAYVQVSIQIEQYGADSAASRRDGLQ